MVDSSFSRRLRLPWLSSDTTSSLNVGLLRNLNRNVAPWKLRLDVEAGKRSSEFRVMLEVDQRCLETWSCIGLCVLVSGGTLTARSDYREVPTTHLEIHSMNIS